MVIRETSQAHKTEANGRLVFRVPAWIQQIVDLPEPIESILFLSNVERDYRRLLKKMQSTDITYSFSASQAEFDYFYHKLYQPFITSRHGEFALVTPYEDMLRWFRRGGMILVHGQEDSRPLAGLVVYLAGQVAYAIESGFVDNHHLWRQGLNPYMYWSFFRWARSQGAKQADLGGSFPVRTHGVFIQKRRWGAKVAMRKRITSSLECTADHLSPELEDHLNLTGLITEIHGKNYGLVFACHQPPPSKEEASRMAKTAGRDGLAGVSIYYKDGSYQMFEYE
jgi:hypothetical protein